MTSVTIVRRIRAKTATVFDLLSTAEGLTSWWGPDDLPVMSAHADVRPCGRFLVRFRRLDGGEHACAGEFLEVERPSRITMTWQWVSGGDPDERGRVSQVEFHLRPIETGCELTLVHAQLCNAATAQSHQGGWSGALDKLQRRLEGEGAS